MNLKQARLKANKTQIEIAKAINLTQNTYSNYEMGKTEPNIETLKKIADYYDVSIDYLVGRNRPFDFPIVATEEQKNVIKTILQLNSINTMKVQAYCLGLLANQN